jgi:ABC-type multidrug transport system fused ATPase/permease subunit
MLFGLMNPDKSTIVGLANSWCLYMFIAALVNFISAFLQKFTFGVVGENITLSVRNALYESIIKKNIGWFDLK